MRQVSLIFVTGDAGYIGSHTCVELLNAGCDVTVFDNFCNSHPEALAQVERITGKSYGWCEATSALAQRWCRPCARARPAQ